MSQNVEVDPVVEAMTLLEEPEQVLEDQEEQSDVFEIIEELSDEEDEEKRTDDSTARDESESSNEFSLSSIKFVLGDALSGSATSLGSAAEKIGTAAESLMRSSFHLPASSVTNDNGAIDNTSGTKSGAKTFVVPSFDGRSLLLRDSGKPPKPPVRLGRFEERVRRLKYTNEDVAEIAEDPEQFEELRLALREMGAMTDTTLKLKLHVYIRNSKREKERLRQEAEEKQRQMQQKVFNTPPTEAHCLGSVKDLEDHFSPHSVRGLYAPQI